MIRVLLLIVLCIFLVALGVKNSQTVSLNYVFGATQPVPVAWLVSGAFATGMVLGWLFGLPAWIRLKLELRRLKKAQDEMEADLNQQRRTTSAGSFKYPTRPDSDEF